MYMSHLKIDWASNTVIKIIILQHFTKLYQVLQLGGGSPFDWRFTALTKEEINDR